MTVFCLSAFASLVAEARLFFDAMMWFIESWTSFGSLMRVMSVVTMT